MNAKWLVVVAMAAVAVISVSGLVSPLEAGKEKPEAQGVEKPVAIDGVLRESDPMDKKTNGPCKTFSFKLQKGKSYVIDLSSDDFDSFLRIENAAGKELAWDDDSGGGLNSRLRFEPTQDGTYNVIACSYDLKPGKFKLQIRQAEPVKDVIPAARAVGKDGFILQGKLTKDLALDEGRFTKGSPRLIQPVTMKAGKSYTIDLISDDFDAFLRLLNPDGKQVAFDDDSGGELNARIVYRCEQDGEFRIVMTNLDRRAGAFMLKVREE
ncbi:MAG: PPC domain-containing protein [Planctomycetes bacterium]|nr:PPC domain-containing protein [Planctomycetota bacterium]